MQKLSRVAGGDRTGAGPAIRSRRPIGRACLVAAVLAAAVGGAALYRTHLDSHLETDVPAEALRSPAYVLGFAYAALAGCDLAPGAELERLAAMVQAGAHGVVPDEVKAGFSDFQGLQQARGQADACRQAERFLGPRAELRPGVLRPR